MHKFFDCISCIAKCDNDINYIADKTCRVINKFFYNKNKNRIYCTNR